MLDLAIIWVILSGHLLLMHVSCARWCGVCMLVCVCVEAVCVLTGVRVQLSEPCSRGALK